MMATRPVDFRKGIDGPTAPVLDPACGRTKTGQLWAYGHRIHEDFGRPPFLGCELGWSCAVLSG